MVGSCEFDGYLSGNINRVERKSVFKKVDD